MTDLVVDTPVPIYYKLLRPNLTHRGFVYKEGLNVLSDPFDPEPKCRAGGLYCADIHNIFSWAKLYITEKMIFIATVELCPDSKIVKMNDKIKTDKLILKNIQSIDNYFKSNPDMCCKAIDQYNKILKYISNQTYELCLKAILLDSDNIEYVKDITSEFYIELCKLAIHKNVSSIEYINKNLNGYDEICMEAVKNNGLALRYIKNKTPEICMKAVKQNDTVFVLEIINNRTILNYSEICMEAVKQNGLALQFIKDISIENFTEICMEAVKQNGLALEYIKNQTPEICTVAVNNTKRALYYVSKNIEIVYSFKYSNISTKDLIVDHKSSDSGS